MHPAIVSEDRESGDKISSLCAPTAATSRRIDVCATDIFQGALIPTNSPPASALRANTPLYRKDPSTPRRDRDIRVERGDTLWRSAHGSMTCIITVQVAPRAGRVANRGVSRSCDVEREFAGEWAFGERFRIESSPALARPPCFQPSTYLLAHVVAGSAEVMLPRFGPAVIELKRPHATPRRAMRRPRDGVERQALEMPWRRVLLGPRSCRCAALSSVSRTPSSAIQRSKPVISSRPRRRSAVYFSREPGPVRAVEDHYRHVRRR